MSVTPRYEGRELRLSNMHNTTNRILKVQGNLIINNVRADPPDSNEPTEVLRLSAADLGELFTRMDIQDQGPHRQEQDGRTAKNLIQGACSNTVEARPESADPLQNEVPHDASSDAPNPDLVRGQQKVPTSLLDEAGCYLLPVMVNGEKDPKWRSDAGDRLRQGTDLGIRRLHRADPPDQEASLPPLAWKAD
ncbi:unnamed protein product [Cyclocybe aegerita]|uniref:Uncharacterized protein n=1 Tax=Cyclocybe aegerita TaxID=1973307 RepID=A0A8S0WCY3_CYCAE|nr:unnamed protein product [Cyclocybe aegerita]